MEGSYSQFLEKKAEFLSAQEQLQETLANKVRREVEWLRRGPKARTSKSRSRRDAAEELMESLDEVRARNFQRTVSVDFNSSHRKTKRLLVVEAVSKSLGGRTLFQDLSFTLSPGDKLGLLGQNGSGKTTLLKLLNGEWTPDAGRLERAEGLRIVTFDQNRQQLNSAETLRRALAPAGDSVIYRELFTFIPGPSAFCFKWNNWSFRSRGCRRRTGATDDCPDDAGTGRRAVAG